MTVHVARSSRKILGGLTAVVLAAAMVASLPGQASAAQSNIGLGTATSYAVLAGSAVSNTGTSVVNGDLGVSPQTAIGGFPPGIVNGTVHSADGPALQAQTDLTVAYNAAAGSGPALSVPTELGGTTLEPGVYTAGTLGMTGTLTLDAKGDSDAVFVLKSADTLVTASNSKVLLIGSANPCNVFWQVTSSATLGTGTSFVGSILALTSITATTGATVEGRLLARNGAVTLDTNVVTPPTCAALPPGTTTTTATTSTTTSAPDTTTTAASTTSATAAPTTTTTTAAPVTTTMTTPAGTPGSPTSPPAITTTTTLARTGLEAGPLAAAGMALVLIGGLFVLTERRRLRARC